MLVSLWFDTEWFFYVTFIDVSADDALLGGGGGGVQVSLITESIDSVIPKSISVGVFPTNKSEKLKPSINFPTDAIHISSFPCFPLRITVLMLRESNSTHSAGIVTVFTAYLNASFFRVCCS